MEEKDLPDFSDYDENSKNLAKQLFGPALYKKLNETKLKAFDWDGLDIRTRSILVCYPGIKQRFNEMSTQNNIERDYTALDMFILSVFHYGFQQAVDSEIAKLQQDIAHKDKTITTLYSILDKSNEKIAQLKKGSRKKGS